MSASGTHNNDNNPYPNHNNRPFVKTPPPQPKQSLQNLDTASFPQQQAKPPIAGISNGAQSSYRSRTTSVSFAPSTAYDPHLTSPHHAYAYPLPTIVEPASSTSYPRRRVSLSIAARGVQSPYSLRPPSRPRRARTMSYPIRAARHDVKPGTTKTRRIVISLLVILFLFLVGTIVVLSTVSYYLAIPSWAYLTEGEVTWRPEDTIKSLMDEPVQNSTRRFMKRDLEDAAAAAADPVLGTEALPEVWKELEEEMEELDAEEETSDETPEYTVNTASFGGSEWGINGEGTGGYWMRKDWDGTVQGTDSWERLFNVTTRPGETIPRLIHQTWKSNQLPEKWQKAWKECREGMPDYEYMLWTDEMSREFIATHYPAHLHMFDSYKYPIQRADSIRYFILHHFGGVYMDLDIGCRRRLDPLLQGDWEVILPITKPVGVSNDLIFSSKRSAFMDDTVHGLSAFNHQYLSNYPTVMFSTGPMFLSAQYAIYSSGHPLTENHPRAEVRILPKSLYGKNAPILTVPHSFFSHFYGSSWHSDDAGFITFLGAWGRKLMWVGAVVLVLGAIRLVWIKRKTAAGQQYQLLSILPTSLQGGRAGDETPTSSTSSGPMSPSATFELGLPQQLPQDIASVFKRAGNLILAAPATLLHGERRRRRTGLLYFVPALFQAGPVPRSRGRTASEASQMPLRRTRRDRERDRERTRAPPPYERAVTDSHNHSPSPVPGSSKAYPAADPTMDEVDAFLNEADTEGEGEGSSFVDEESGPEGEWTTDWSSAKGARS